MPAANVDRLPAVAEELLHEVRLSTPSTQWLVLKNELFIDHQHWLGNKEPLALTAKCTVLASVAFAGRNVIARERFTDVLRLEGIHCLAHARGTARHSRDEPFTFVMSAQE